MPTPKRFPVRDFYKAVGADGFDMFTHETDYSDAIGCMVQNLAAIGESVEPLSGPRLCSPDVLHAYDRLTPCMGLGRWGEKWCGSRITRIFIVRGRPVVKGSDSRSPSRFKYGFYDYEVIKEITSRKLIVDTLVAENRNRSARFLHHNGSWKKMPMTREEAESIYLRTMTVYADSGRL